MIIKEKYNLHKILIWLIMVVMTGPLAGQSSLPASVYRQVSRPLPSDISNPELEKLSEQLEKWIRQWEEQTLPTDSTYGLLLQRKGVVASWLNEPREALKWFASAKSVFSNDGGDTQISSIPKTEYLMGESYLFSNDYPNALKVFKSILELPLGEASTSFWQVNSTLQIAYIYNAYGDFDKAIDILDKGLHLYCKPCSPDKAGRLYFEKAFSLRKLGRFQEAIGMLQMCLNHAKEARNHRESVRIHESLGSAYAVLNNVDSALVHFQNAMRISQQHHLTVPNNLYTNIGFMYHKNNDYDHAQSYYKKALANETDRYSKVRILTNLARVHTATGSYTESENHLMSALLLASPELKKPTKESLNAATVKLVPRKEYWLDWITSLADNYRASALGKGPEKLKLALSTYMLADTMTDYMRWEHTGEASKLFWRDRTRLLYENAIETCFLLNDPERAFYFFEKSRAAILQDQLQELGAAQLLSVADQQKETELKSKIRQLQEKSINLPADSPELNTVRTSLFDTREVLSAFVKGLEVSNPTYHNYRYGHHVPSTDLLRKSILMPSQGYLAYFIGESACYGLYIDQSRAVLKKIDLAEYKNLLAEYGGYLSDKVLQNQNFRGFLKISHQLHQLLVTPFDIPGGTRLVISPDGPLLPFAAFSRSSESEDFLIRSHPISYTYSATFLAGRGRAPKPWYSPNLFFGLSPVSFAPALNQAPLPNSDRILRKLDDLFLFSRNLNQEKASKAAFLKHFPDYPIVQLFTHASADTSAGHGSLPALFFADSTLKLTELTARPGSITELVVLSACETGIGIDQRGEGVFSLARGFAGIGIPSTLTTLWRAESEAIYALTEWFYEGIVGGMPLDRSLQQAQVRWLDTREKTDQLPYTWAGNVLVGNVSPVLKPRPSFALYGILFVVLLLIIIQIVKKRNREK